MSDFSVTKRNGKQEKFNPEKINRAVGRACKGLEDRVSVSEIITDSQLQMYDGIKTVEIDSVCVPCGDITGCTNCDMNGCIECDEVFGFYLNGT